MHDVLSTIGVFALGGIGWLLTSFVGRPVRKFVDLRGEVIHRSVLYDNVPGAHKEFQDGSVEHVDLSGDELKRLREAEFVFRDLAAQMRAFALNERLAMWLVKWRYDPWDASEALLRVSNTLYKHGGTRAQARERLEQTLGFRVSR